LVRVLLLCALPKMAFERVAKLARGANLARLSSVALFKRLCKAQNLLREIFLHLLGYACAGSEFFAGYRLLAVDATVLCGPGAKGTDQRLHVVYDLGKGLPIWVDVTGPEGGESLCRHHCFSAGDLVLGDRGYGHGSGLIWALQSGARVLVRFEFESIRLLNADGRKITPDAARAGIPAVGAVEFEAYLPKWDKPLRVIGERNPKGDVVWLLTDMSCKELPVGQARTLYSRRWQIELFFKRLKSLLDLDEIPSRGGPSAKAWIWAKLVLAALAVLISHERFSPWGCPPERERWALEVLRPGSVGPRQDIAKPQTASTKKGASAQKTRKNTQPLQTALLVESPRCLS